MGQSSSNLHPTTSKVSTSGQNADFIFAASAMQGWRKNMEDYNTALLDIGNSTSYFGVYDGHGGYKVAKYAHEQLHRLVSGSTMFRQGQFSAALKSSFLDFDEWLKNAEGKMLIPGGPGSTSNVLLITKDYHAYCANIGDCRAVLCRKGEAVALSLDHKPGSKGEIDRIHNAGGYVKNGRVNGRTAISRAFGDFDYKVYHGDLHGNPEEFIITANPDVCDCQLTLDDEFIILASDGIWDVVSNDMAVAFVRERLAIHNGDLVKAADDLLDRCLSQTKGLVGSDNMTVILVGLLMGRTTDEWLSLVTPNLPRIQLSTTSTLV
ncbi:uncharacterized protein BJ171DRAFT_216474 [Polychytrium aggregatum]|uniref:uncharacterized protein n=1 Tax=Polychytrium aggregatum TaxID=110093 RepID=UPI0022FE1714|nr:uncharacterized protein BJ171DRAFT_216474 [Polychytrium aggregatum]KAI9199345.1 hypothetical protein BJ171DRAFT_216474 [Polychytrium aggregatum]